MYRALYRKWRPQRFGDVVGQEAITTALSNQITAGKVGHAYMFTGTRGTGKTTCAKIFAKAVNCENRDGAEPCGSCVCCMGLDDGSILDVIEIDAASNNSVDDIRDLRDATVYRPSRCLYRVYIIDEVHMLSTQAFNALLKILEEPPAHVLFILATTEIHKVPATILSRCQRFDFYRIPPEKIAARLGVIAAAEQIELSQEAADLIARIADGSLRDAVSLLDTCAGLGQAVDGPLVRRMAGIADKSYLFDISDAVMRQDVPGLMALVTALREKSIDVRRLCEELVNHYRNFLLLLADPSGQLLDTLPTDEMEYYTNKMASFTENYVIRAIKRLAAALDGMGRSPDPRIELELALFDMCGLSADGEPSRQRPAATAPSPAVAPQPAPNTPPQAPATLLAAEKPEPQAPVPPQVPPSQPPEALQAGSETVFQQWPQVLERMAQLDRMLYSYMKATTAFVDDKRVLIDGGDIFLTFIKDNESARERIKTVIQEITGRRYGIGPYKNDAAKQTQHSAQKTARETLSAWEAKGVPVEYTNIDREAES